MQQINNKHAKALLLTLIDYMVNFRRNAFAPRFISRVKRDVVVIDT